MCRQLEGSPNFLMKRYLCPLPTIILASIPIISTYVLSFLHEINVPAYYALTGISFVLSILSLVGILHSYPKSPRLAWFLVSWLKTVVGAILFTAAMVQIFTQKRPNQHTGDLFRFGYVFTTFGLGWDLALACTLEPFSGGKARDSPEDAVEKDSSTTILLHQLLAISPTAILSLYATIVYLVWSYRIAYKPLVLYIVASCCMVLALLFVVYWLFTQSPSLKFQLLFLGPVLISMIGVGLHIGAIAKRVFGRNNSRASVAMFITGLLLSGSSFGWAFALSLTFKPDRKT